MSEREKKQNTFFCLNIAYFWKHKLILKKIDRFSYLKAALLRHSKKQKP